MDPGEFKDAVLVVSGTGAEDVDVDDEDVEPLDAVEGRNMYAAN